MAVSPLATESWVRRYKRLGKAYGNYFGFYRFPGEPKDARRRVDLHVRDKRVAEQRLREIIQQEHAIREGLAPAPEVLAAVRKSLREYVEQFITDLESREASREYTRKIRQRITSLAEACRWQRVGDIDKRSFEQWRADQPDMAPKTKNHYLDAAFTFGGWLVELDVLEQNPLRNVRKAKVAGVQKRPRRPLTRVEAHQLIGAVTNDQRRALYLTAMLTGARANELHQLVWADFDLDGGWVTLRASTTKNSKTSRLPIPGELIAELRRFRRPEVGDGDRVFPTRVSGHTFDADLKRAGIAKQDALGRAVSFHSFRSTYNQLLQESGTPLRHAQQLMRHSDPRLTANTYLDADRLSIEDCVRNLPRIGGDAPIC
ncbi:MAG: tyrosine-type recombinase/integrase, partial [Planctomycetota bacterium]